MVLLLSSPLVSFRQAFPKRVGPDHSLNELLPQHTLRDYPLPLFTYQLCSAKRTCIQKRQDVLCNVIQALGWTEGTEVSVNKPRQQINTILSSQFLFANGCVFAFFSSSSANVLSNFAAQTYNVIFC